jgi:predicted lipoprotein
MSVFKDKIIKIACAAAALIFTSTSFADYKMTDDAWKVQIVPYIWAISMNGTVQTGPLRAHIDETFGDI